MKKTITLVLLLTTQISQSGFWTHIWNNTNNNILVRALESRPKVERLFEVAGHIPSIVSLDTSTPFLQKEDFIRSKKSKHIGFFENDFHLIPFKVLYKPTPYKSGHYIGGTIKALKFKLFPSKKTFTLYSNDYTFKNRYLEIQKTKNGNLKVRWYFSFNKGPWKTIKN